MYSCRTMYTRSASCNSDTFFADFASMSCVQGTKPTCTGLSTGASCTEPGQFVFFFYIFYKLLLLLFI